jgi:glycosyltransferase involved in cell wall biosynthesis
MPRIAFVVNNVAFFVSHRLPLAVTAEKNGFKVRLITGQAGSEIMEKLALKQLKSAGIEHTRCILQASGTNPVIEFIGLAQLIFALFCFRPDIVHCVSPKGVIYGGIAARVCRIPRVVHAISGLGYMQTTGDARVEAGYLTRFAYRILLKFAFHKTNATFVVQNSDDFEEIKKSYKISPQAIKLIRGSGIDLDRFARMDPRAKSKVVLLPARMLKDKGVVDFVSAVRLIKTRAIDWRFVLCGAADYDNPSSVGANTLADWCAEGVVEWVGHVDDMLPWYNAAAIVCLPSYREGMPKALLEAAAAGCAVITTDVPGCREAVRAGETGDLVPVNNPISLADALISLIDESERRVKYGVCGRAWALKNFSLDTVVNETLKIYLS